MVGLGPEMLRKVGMIWSLCTGVQSSPGFPDVANDAQAPVKTSRTAASWMHTGIRHNKCFGYQTHVSGKLVSLCVPARAPKHWLPFIEEVISMGYTVLLKDII